MAKPKLALIPAAQGSKLFSVLPSSGVGDFDFTRSGSATRINSQGLIETVGNGVSRLNYPMIDGKVVGCPHHILEPQRTNLITYSEDFSNAYWSKIGSSITSNAVISPDGTLNGSKLIENTATSAHLLYRFVTVPSNVDHTETLYFKKGERKYAFISTTGFLVETAIFDIELGAVSYEGANIIDAKIEELANGWFKCQLTTNTVTTSNAYQFGASSDGVSITYTGDGTSGVYIWGAMLEQGSYPTSYIKSNGSATTRSAETANGSGDAATFNDSEGVLMAEVSALVNNGESRRISISHSADDTSNRITLEVDETTSTIKAFMSSGNVTVGSITVNNINQTNNNKIALLYKENTFEMHINGFLLGSDYTIASLPIELSRLQLEGANGSNDFYGKTKQVQYYNSALTESELSQLTSWTSFTDMAEGQLYTIE